MKNDDLTETLLSGNKVRKLEFILAEAQAKGADTLITCGGLQSNHCRATAIPIRSISGIRKSKFEIMRNLGFLICIAHYINVFYMFVPSTLLHSSGYRIPKYEA